MDFSDLDGEARRGIEPYMITFHTELTNEVGIEGWIMLPHQPLIDWCNKFCTDKFMEVYTQYASTFFFRNKEDALYFKTVWGSRNYPITNEIHWDRSKL